MDAAEIVAHINNDRRTSYRMVGRYAAGESGTAMQLIDKASNRYVLKYGSGHEFRAENAARTTAKLRDLGYPAPEYVAIGRIEATSYVLQRAMPGTPIGAGVTMHLLPKILRLNDLQRGQGESENGEPGRIIRGVMEGYADFCVIETFRRYSTETAKMLDTLQRVVARNAGECPKRNDIVHFDFHTGNILSEGDRITGVIDWEGSVSGDCAFDLATTLFYTWRFADFREALWRVLMQRTTRGAVTVYLAHMIVRQLDWTIRHHDAATVGRYMDDAREIIRASEQL